MTTESGVIDGARLQDELLDLVSISHTVNEWVDVRDVALTAELVVETVRRNAAA